jgi:hypothetical protein
LFHLLGTRADIRDPKAQKETARIRAAFRHTSRDSG